MVRITVSLAALAVAGWSMAGPVVALAQSTTPVVPTPPPSANPSLPTREQVNPPAPETATPKSTAKVDESGAVDSRPCPLADSTIRMSVHEVRFTAPGGGPLAPQLAKLLSGITLSGDSQPVAAVCQLRDSANARLRAARYVASVQVPAQRIDGGVLRLEVVAGHIVSVRVKGDAGPFESLIRQRIEDLKKLSPLNAGDAERLLLVTNDVPGLAVRLGLSPDLAGGKPGDLIGDLTVSYRRFVILGNVQNYNSTYLGRETFYLRGEYYNLLGLNDRAFVAGSATFDFKKQLVAQVGEMVTLNGNGDRLSVTGTIAKSRPDLQTLDLRTLSLIGNIEYNRPIVRTVNSRVELSAGFEFAEQRTRVYSGGASQPLNRDRISTLYLRANGDTRQLRSDGTQKWTIGGYLELRQGLDMFGATHANSFTGGYSPSHFAGSAIATVVRGEVSGTIGVGPIFELASTLHGQWSNRSLLNYDQFAIGNLTIGRGYDPGANTGDRMIGGQEELRVNVPLHSDKYQAQLYGFYDWVKLWNLDPTSTERHRFLASVGGGARFVIDRTVRVDLTYAHPLDPPLLTGTNIKPSADRFMFSLTTNLIPFGPAR